LTGKQTDHSILTIRVAPRMGSVQSGKWLVSDASQPVTRISGKWVFLWRRSWRPDRRRQGSGCWPYRRSWPLRQHFGPDFTWILSSL